MLNKEVQQLLLEKGLVQYKTLRDIDGPGIGNAGIQEREERPEEGGIYVYVYGYKYPYKGIPDEESIRQICVVKKIFLHLINSIKNKSVLIRLGLLFLLPRFFTKRIVDSTIDFFYATTTQILYWVVLNPKRYCNCVRELYRTFTVLIEREKDEANKKALTMARDISCMIIEQDSAYKFRFQDIMAEVDVKEIRKGGLNTRREIRRLLALLKEREFSKEFAQNKWGVIERIFPFVFLIGDVRKIINNFVREVDFKKLSPDEGDWYYDTLRYDYEFGGKRLEERIEERKKIDPENWNKYNFDELAKEFLKDYHKYKPAEVVNNGKNNIAISN
jgi:hypothetical protein